MHVKYVLPDVVSACFSVTFSCMRCNHTDGMPRGAFNIYFASNRHGYVRAEEWVPLTSVNIPDSGVTAALNKHPNCDFPHRTVGIVLLVVILAALFVLGCWYFKKRSGYKLIRVSPPRLPVVM